MFTGIIEEVGEVLDITGDRMRVRADHVIEGIKLGQSVSIDGVDLTVIQITGTELAFNVMPETYR